MNKSGATILVIEDDRSLLEALRSHFEGEGFNVVGAENGEDGLRLALAGHPDVILLDVMLPKMNGEEVLKALRSDEWGKTVPIVMLTNMSFLQDSESKELIDEYILKSTVKLTDLADKVRALLGA